jgi:hypothetical protein
MLKTQIGLSRYRRSYLVFFCVLFIASIVGADPSLPQLFVSIFKSAAVFEDPEKPKTFRTGESALADYIDWRLAFVKPSVAKKVRLTLEKATIQESKEVNGHFSSIFDYDGLKDQYLIQVPGRDPWLEAYITAHEVEHQIQKEAMRPYRSTLIQWPVGIMDSPDSIAFEVQRNQLSFYAEAGAITAEYWLLQRMPIQVRNNMLATDFQKIPRKSESLRRIRRVWRNASLPVDSYLAAEWRARRYSPAHFRIDLKGFKLSEFARFEVLFSSEGCQAIFRGSESAE